MYVAQCVLGMCGLGRFKWGSFKHCSPITILLSKTIDYNAIIINLLFLVNIVYIIDISDH